MAVSPKQKTVLAIVLGAIVAIAPSFFSFLQARQEIREKSAENHAESAQGYETLVAAVKDLQKTVLAIVLGAIVAIAPSFFSFLQARQEIREKSAENHAESAQGDETLVAAVKDLQKTVLEQHDYVVKLEGQNTTLTNVLGQLSS